VRDRVLLAIAALPFSWSRPLIGQITAGQDIKIVKDIGLATLELAGVLMAVFIGGLVSREIGFEHLQPAREPIHRWSSSRARPVGTIPSIYC
jgi:hypothetical protein